MGRIEVPTFDNTVAGFKEFKKRCNLYRARMKIEQREKQVALAILGQLTGLAWQACHFNIAALWGLEGRVRKGNLSPRAKCCSKYLLLFFLIFVS